MIKTHLMDVISKAMDGSSLRHTAITNNLANVNTPGYKRLEVSFQDALAEAVQPTKMDLKRTNPKHFSLRSPLDDGGIVQISTDNSTSLRTDGNNVDVDIELATLAENNLYFNGLTQMLTGQLTLLRQSITEGRR